MPYIFFSFFFFFTVLADQATGSATLNALLIQEKRARGRERPSKFGAAVTSRCHRLHMRSEGNFSPIGKLR